MKSDSTRKLQLTETLYAFDHEEAGGNRMFIGIDEAGRGPLAGPVVAAAVCLDPSNPIEGINDSKKLSAAERERLYEKIIVSAVAWAIGSVTSGEIDRINILQATFVAMSQAAGGIGVPWTLALIDGNRPVPQISAERQKTIVKGDARSASIAAASIVAKVSRDRVMDAFHLRYPEYSFNEHKGYGTALHRRRIIEKGLCAIHRVSFCGNLLQTTLSL